MEQEETEEDRELGGEGKEEKKKKRRNDIKIIIACLIYFQNITMPLQTSFWPPPMDLVHNYNSK